MIDSFNVYIQPLMPIWFIVAATVILLCALCALCIRLQRVLIFRFIFVVLMLVLLVNPSIKHETGVPSKTKVMVVVDKTQSQFLSNRDDSVDKIENYVTEKLNSIEGVEVEKLYVTSEKQRGKTYIFTPLQDALLQLNKQSFGGSILITDGHVHDVPTNTKVWERFGPIHTILSGDPNTEYDRRIAITSSANYAVVGEDIPLVFKIDIDPDIQFKKTDQFTVTVTVGAEQILQRAFTAGIEHSLNIPINQPGQNLIRLNVEAHDDELSQINNTAAIKVEGIRDRLKVLLISGQPYEGLRIWRNLLKSDPAVELVHFTILRSRSNIDVARQSELALIPFPTHELFEEKIDEFDLIIMDRYTRRSILLPEYFINISNFVKQGGGLLVVHGSEETGDNSLSNTALKDVLPSLRMENGVVDSSYKARLTDLAKRHPITDPLLLEEQSWGAWQSYLQGVLNKTTHDVLLETKDQSPLLLINKVGEGRVAQFMTDQIWYWARGYNGGGPYTDLIRRLSHWLMKEPSLEYSEFSVREGREGLIITYDAKTPPDNLNVTVVSPDMSRTAIELTPKNSYLEAHFEPLLNGLYSFEFDNAVRTILVGQTNDDEHQKLVTNAEALSNVVQETGGRLVSLTDYNALNFALKPEASYYSRGNTLYFKQSGQLENRNVYFTAFIPYLLALILGMLALILGWLRQE